MNDKPRVDKITLTVGLSGPCAECGKHAKRQRSFYGDTLNDLTRQSEEWAKTAPKPFRHKKCER